MEFVFKWAYLHFHFEEILEILQKHWTKASSTLHVHKTSKIKDEFEHCNGAQHSFSGQPVPVAQNPHKQDFLPYIQVKSTFFSLKSLSIVLDTIGHSKKSF